MSEKKQVPPPRSLLVTAADRERLEQEHPEGFRHPWNPRSEIHGCMLGRQVGLERLGVSLMRVPAGKESFIYHRHNVEEEFAFIVSGRGVVEIGEETFDLGPGDFVGFPPRTHAHHIRNTGSEDLVYLCGGESAPTEIGDFPREGKRMVKIGQDVTVYPLAGEPFSGGRGRD
ncbi:MAG: cupin domain-containing protein [Myxococcales bacterium]